MAEKPKYGSKSSEDPNRRHFFRWKDGPGVGVGKCMYCDLKMKFKEDGPRGGKVRMYSKDGKSWSEKELQCHVREHAVAAKEPAKKKAAKKNGTKRAANGTKKKAVAAKSPRKGGAKKRAGKKKAEPAAEAAQAPA